MHPLTIRIILGSFVIAAVLIVANLFTRPTHKSTILETKVPVQQEQFIIEPVVSRHEYGQYDFSDIAILQSGELWAVGYDGQDPRRMWNSTDGGRHWQRISIQSKGFVLHAIDFADSQNGWAVGNNGTIMATHNGGKTWQATRHWTTADLTNVKFVNPQVGYVAGTTGLYDPRTVTRTFGMEILRTSDGGKTWRRCYNDRTTFNIWGIATLTENIAVVALDGSRLIRTTDGGKTWQPIQSRNNGFHSVIFAPDGTAWAVGKDAFYKSTDKGRTWNVPENLPEGLLKHDYWSIAFANKKIGMAVSEDCAITMTYDGGLSWIEVKSNLHEGDTIWYRKDIQFKENLRAIRLKGEIGVILGSQRVLMIRDFGLPWNQSATLASILSTEISDH